MLRETARQLKALWQKSDATEKIANEALTLAKHADKGYIETYSKLQNLEGDQKDMKKTLDVVKVDIENIPKEIQEKLSSNLKWIIGTLITTLVAFLGITITIMIALLPK